MAQKKKKAPKTQTFLSPEKYITQKARTLEIGNCYISEEIESCGEGIIVICRNHAGGNVTAGFYLVDTFCLGVKKNVF